MKKTKIVIMAIIMILVFVSTGCAVTTDPEPETQQQDTAAQEESAENDFGAKSALTKEDLSIEQMLRYAIEDEYLARQEYESIMEEFGEQKPFSNIIKAEENHIAWLKGIYDDYGYEIPEDKAIDYIVLPDSIEQALELGVQAEIDNIAMYEKFLEQELPEDITDVFVELRDASKNHLEAFKKGVRGGGNQ